MKTKEDKLWTAVIILVIMVFELAFAIVFAKDLIDDLQATAYGYDSDRNLCRSQLDSLTQELEKWQNE